MIRSMNAVNYVHIFYPRIIEMIEICYGIFINKFITAYILSSHAKVFLITHNLNDQSAL